MTEAAASEHTLTVRVRNEFGVLSRVVGLFSARGYNIDSLCVAESLDPAVSQITIVTRGNNEELEQITKQLNKLIDVIEVSHLIRNKSVTRELALIRINAENSKDRSDIMSYTDVFRGRVVDVTPTNIMIEITGAPDKINAFIEIISDFKIEELARTGMTALPRG